MCGSVVLFALVVLFKKGCIRIYLKILDLILVDVWDCLDAFIDRYTHKHVCVYNFFQKNNLKII